MRVATFNILHGRAPTDERVDPSALAEAVRQLAASFIPWWNLRQLHRLVRATRSLHGPVVLMGDLNMDSRRAAMVTGLQPAATHATFPAGDPQEQIDHILWRGALTAERSAAVHLPISDHRAVWVELREEAASVGDADVGPVMS